MKFKKTFLSKNKYWQLMLILVFFFSDCKKKDPIEEEQNTETVFDKQALLVNFADQLILPAYTNFQTSLSALITAFDNYSNTLNESGLQLVKVKFDSLYKDYQHICIFEIGPAENILVRTNFNIYPTDTIQIKSNITNQNYNLSAASNVDAKGLPALDFLFYGNHSSQNEVHQLFVSSPDRRKYVKDLLQDMKVKVDAILIEWNNTYRTTFINSLGTDVGSSIGLLINQLNFELDNLKNAKIGTPLGKKTLGVPAPGNCEALYAANSLANAYESLKAIEQLYFGKSSSGSNGIGFDDYLDHLKIEYNGETLNSAITKQIALAKTKLTAIALPLSQQVVSDPAPVEAAYVELVKLLVLLKTDLPSNLGVVITYQDGDGD